MDKSRLREDTDESDESEEFLDVSKQRPSVQTPPPAVPAATPSRTGSRASWRPGLLDLMSGGAQCPTCRGTGRLPRGEGRKGETQFREVFIVSFWC